MRNKKSAVSLEDAKKIIARAVEPLADEKVAILEALGRVLSEDVTSDVLIPPLDSSAMDGYAVRAGDTAGAAPDRPVELTVAGEVQAGGSAEGKHVEPGTAVRIMTGAPIPRGADAVVKVEDTKEAAGVVAVFAPVAGHENYRHAGEDIAPGDRVLYKGERLNSADIGILASLNRGRVKVFRQPRVAIISTGDELAGLGEDVPFGKIRDVNAYTVYSEATKCNALPKYLGIARDTADDVRRLFLEALQSDVVISTGGVSMGRYDFVKSIFADLQIDIHFEWVKVKPGKPCAFGTKEGKLYFGLPGNPVSTLTSFIQFVRPALLRLMGANKLNKPLVNAYLEEDIKKNKTDKVRLLRGRFSIRDNEFYVTTTGDQKTSIFRSMSEANCLIVIPENAAVHAGDKVTIQLIDHEEI